jgi:ring-1,2-phenylacetyl-CoA epoxidase subunit PaaC
VEPVPIELQKPLIDLLLSIADDKFILGHRNADWTGLAPILEADIAFSPLSQDELAHASAIYQLVAGILGTTADRLAYGRKPEEYRCAAIVELSDEFDWGTAIARNFYCDHFDAVRLNRLTRSHYSPVAHLALRLEAEERIHVEHVDGWVTRLGQGGDEAHRRLQTALDKLAPLASGLFEPTDGLDRLEANTLFPIGDKDAYEKWSADLHTVADGAGLTLRLSRPSSQSIGGRRGRHSADFAALLDELTEVYRLEPEAAW